MQRTGLARSRRTPAAPEPPPPPREGRRAAPSREISDYGSVLRWALLASVLLHLLVLVLSPALVRVGPPPGTTDTPYLASRPTAEIQLLIPVASDQAPAEPEAEPARAETPRREDPRPLPRGTRAIVPVPGAARPESAPAGAVGREPAAAAEEALRPGYRDPRLWVNPRDLTAPRREASRHERYMEQLQARIDAQNDSLYGRGPDTDWTTRDKQGRRWGLSEEGLHLGGLTVPRALIPVPAATGDNQSLEAAREEQRQRDEIRRQEEGRDRRKTQEERAAATRERREQEKKKSGGG